MRYGVLHIGPTNSGKTYEALQKFQNAEEAVYLAPLRIEAIKLTLENTPPELAADVMERGIVLTGGGALIKGLDKLITETTKIPTHVAEYPLDCVAIGTGKALDNIKELIESSK